MQGGEWEFVGSEIGEKCSTGIDLIKRISLHLSNGAMIKQTGER